MSLEIEIIPHKEYIEVFISGEYDMQEAVDKFLLVLDACKMNGRLKVLIDYRKLQGEIYATQKVFYAEQVISKIKNYFALEGKGLQIAYVGKAPQVSTYEPSLEVAEREEIQAIVTEDINEAWNLAEGMNMMDGNISLFPLTKENVRSLSEFRTNPTALNPESKTWVIEELTSWQTTFENEVDEDGDDDDSGWDELERLIDNVKADSCTKDDYEEVIFHLWQHSFGKDEG